MAKCKITVLKKTLHQEYADQYCKEKVGICDRFNEGDEFMTDNSSTMPEGFCGYAWVDIQRLVMTLMHGGDFGSSSWNWMNDDKIMIACCTDGIRPVVFKLERIE